MVDARICPLVSFAPIFSEDRASIDELMAGSYPCIQSKYEQEDLIEQVMYVPDYRERFGTVFSEVDAGGIRFGRWSVPLLAPPFPLVVTSTL